MIKHTIEIGGRNLTLETGHIARQSAGSVKVTYGETVVLVAVNAAKVMREDIDFFPLQVEYRERHYAGGKIPGGFFKREGRPSEKEVLAARLTDRPIRPLFPKTFKYETQVIITVLASDGENSPDILAGIGASAALMISDIPWNGPLATVRVGLIGEEFVINPGTAQLEQSELDLIVSGNDQSIIMVEGEAFEVPEDTIIQSLKFAHTFIKDIIALQRKLLSEGEVTKRPVPEAAVDPNLLKSIHKHVSPALKKIGGVTGKTSHQTELEEVVSTTVEELAEEYPEAAEQIAGAVLDLHRDMMRENILTKGKRMDGRGLTAIRPISIEPGYLPRIHGSALFTRGETQALVTITLGTKRDEQIIDDIDRDYTKRYMLHYNFPPYSVGEVRRITGVSRREVGHGNLAERALKPIIPSAEDFPYTIRIVSDILESNGSSSMATVCGGSLALMDAGVPIREHVAGVAMGLITDGQRHAILTDILGAEDHLGDMDFKIAGTARGVTAIQLDLKIEGLSFELLAEALEQAREGRFFILEKMTEALPKSKPEVSKYAPKILILQINPEKIGLLIGPGGKNIKKITADTECEIDVDDSGLVFISGVDLAKCDDARELIKALTMEPEIGNEYDVVVTRLMTFGAFVEYAPGREGLIHISELDWKRTERVADVVKPGDKLRAKLIKVDDQGRFDFSRKAVLPKPEGYVDRPPRDRFSHGSRDRSPRRGFGGDRPHSRERYQRGDRDQSRRPGTPDNQDRTYRKRRDESD